MAKIVTENFKVETTKELYKSLEGENFYAVASASRDKDTFLSDPRIENTQFSKRDFLRKIIFGKKIQVVTRKVGGSVDTNLARYMFLENAWEEGRVYDAFDDTKDVDSLNMFVTVRQEDDGFIVLKCIDNNNGAVSTNIVGATDASNWQFFTGSDGYVWHKMFTVTADDAELYSTPDSLPLPEFDNGYGDSNVVENTKEAISRIVVEDTLENQYNQYIFGPATSINDASDVLCINPDASTDTLSTVKNVVIQTTVVSGRTLYTEADAYKNMYLRATTGATAGKLYDVIASTTSSDTNQITLSINTTDTFVAQQIYQLVLKVNVSQSELEAERCKAYGKIDQFGTLKSIAFESRGTKYKYATAEIVYPPFLKGSNSVRDNPTVLRAVVSPRGGHGSDSITEMAMSKLTISTVFSGGPPINVDSNLYSIVGLIKNPTFTNATDAEGAAVDFPDEFDNRVKVTLDGNQRTVGPISTAFPSGKPRIAGGGEVGHYIKQFIEVLSVQDLGLAQFNKSVKILEVGNLSTSEWQSLGAVNVAVGEEFTITAQVNPLPNNKVGSISVVYNSSRYVRDTDPFYDFRYECIVAQIHDIVYDETLNKTYVYLVDHYGDFMHKLHRGNFFIVDTPTSYTVGYDGNTSINNKTAEDVSYGSLDAYSGDVLHYIDFNPVARNANKNENIKFTFDF